MATLRKPLFFLILLLLSLTVTQITSHTPPQTTEFQSSEPGDTDLKHELDRLKSKISSLESTIDERSCELSKKDEYIRELEMTIQEKSESTSNSRARATELEKQVHGEWLLHWLAVPIYHFQSYMVSHWNDHGRPALDITIQKVVEKKDQLKIWAGLQIRNSITHLISMMKDGCSKFIKFLASHLRSLPSKIIDVYDASKNSLIPRLVYHWNDRGRPALDITIQKTLEKKDQLKSWAGPQIRNVNTHLISMMKDGWSKFINSLESHLRSLPSKIFDVYDSSKNSLMPLLVSHWNDHGRHTLDITIQKALEKKDQLKSWAGPQISNINMHLIPMMKDEWSKFINYLEPHLWSLLSKTSDVYDASKNSLAPHLVKARKLTDHYIQEGKKFSEPYINYVVMMVTALMVFRFARRYVIHVVMVVIALTVFGIVRDWVLKKLTERFFGIA